MRGCGLRLVLGTGVVVFAAAAHIVAVRAVTREALQVATSASETFAASDYAVSVPLTRSRSESNAFDPALFVREMQDALRSAFSNAPSPTMDDDVDRVMDSFVDLNAMSRHAFRDHWDELTRGQRSQVAGLLRALVQKNCRTHLIKARDYEIAFKNVRQRAKTWRVETEATPKIAAREMATRVDYVLENTGNGYRVVDLVIEGSSITRNYYVQFHKMLTTESQGYPYLVDKLRSKVANRDAAARVDSHSD